MILWLPSLAMIQRKLKNSRHSPDNIAPIICQSAEYCCTKKQFAATIGIFKRLTLIVYPMYACVSVCVAFWPKSTIFSQVTFRCAFLAFAWRIGAVTAPLHSWGVWWGAHIGWLSIALCRLVSVFARMQQCDATASNCGGVDFGINLHKHE